MPKKWLLLLLFIIIALSLMTYQSNRQQLLQFNFLNAALNRFHEMKSSMTDALSSPFHRMMLREQENRELKSEIGKMLKEQQACREIFYENKTLRGLLALKEREHRYIT
jgi:cell shape-determining protein MreC